jgi:hypothetical protein
MPNPAGIHVQVSADLVRSGTLSSVLEVFSSRTAARNAFLVEAWQFIQQSNTKGGQLRSELRGDIEKLQQQADRLAHAIAEGGELSALLKRSQFVHKELRTAMARMQEVESPTSHRPCGIQRDAFLADPLPSLLEICSTSYDFHALMKATVYELLVIPVQDLLNGQVRPRIKMKVRLPDEPNGATAPAVFDAFRIPQHIQNACRLRHRKDEHPEYSHSQWAAELGIHNRASRATTWRLGRLLRRELPPLRLGETSSRS